MLRRTAQSRLVRSLPSQDEALGGGEFEQARRHDRRDRGTPIAAATGGDGIESRPRFAALTAVL
jgi:hypothetical protein